MATAAPAAFPDVRRADAGTILMSSWIVPQPRFQRPAADAVIEEWERQERPDAMLSLTTFLSTDGSQVLNYAQWTHDDAHREWVRTRRPAAIGRIDESIPGIERPGVVRHALYGSYAPRPSPDERPGLLVTPAFETQGPGSQRALADTALGLLERIRPQGLLGAHFHLSKDGRRAVNYAEWSGLADWRRFADGDGSAELRSAIVALDGVTVAHPRLAAPHYVPHRGIVNVPAP